MTSRERWRRQHRGQLGTTSHRNGGKVAYATWTAADRAARNMNNLHRMQESPPVYEFYWCTWADQFHLGETADMHWHVGRKSTGGSDAVAPVQLSGQGRDPASR